MCKIGVTSDLHGFLPEVEPVDLFMICGDIMPLEIQCNMPKSEKWLKGPFSTWANNLPAEKVIFIAGNHDFWFETYTATNKPQEIFSGDKIVYLKDNFYTYNHEDKNYLIYGTPYCKLFGMWAFMTDPTGLAEIYSNIPYGCDILLTHDAPKMLDLGMIKDGKWAGEDAGNPILADEILRKQPRYNFCGHIHSGEHELQDFNNMQFANVSLVGEDYKIHNTPLYLDI